MCVLFPEFTLFCLGGRAGHPPREVKAPHEERDPEAKTCVEVNPPVEKDDGKAGCKK